MRLSFFLLFVVLVVAALFQIQGQEEGDQAEIVIPVSRLDAFIRETEKMSDPEEIRVALRKFRDQFRKPVPVGEPLPGQSWFGSWRTTYGEMTLRIDGQNEFTGNYGPSRRSLWGTFDPDRPHELSGYWKHTNSTWTGRFRFVFTKQDSFEGTWTSGSAEPNLEQVNWTGTRKTVMPP